MKEYINSQLKEISDCLKKLQNETETVMNIVDVCLSAIRNGNKIIFCGNGGSAAQSQHLAAELVGHYKMERQALPAISLTVDTSNITAIANDYGYEFIFARQLEGIGKKNDVLIGLSTSGNSKNIVLAFEKAKKMGIITVGFIGDKYGAMQDKSDYILHVPSSVSAHIQEMHITIGHLLCDLIEKEICYSD